MMLTTLPPPPAAHQPRGLLHEQERRAGVDREQPVPQLGARVVERAAAAEPGGVDQPVEAAEALRRRRRSTARQSASRASSAGDEHARRPRARRGPPRRAGARARRRRCPRRPAARARRAIAAPRPWVPPVTTSTLPSRRWSANGSLMRSSTSSMRTGRPSRSDRQAARPITSGARASAGPTGGVAPAAQRGDERLPLAQVARHVALEEEVRQRRGSRVPSAVRTTAVCASGFSEAAMPREPNTSTRWS